MSRPKMTTVLESMNRNMSLLQQRTVACKAAMECGSFQAAAVLAEEIVQSSALVQQAVETYLALDTNEDTIQ